MPAPFPSCCVDWCVAGDPVSDRGCLLQAMTLCRWLARWQLFFRTRRRTLRLLVLTSTAACSLLVLALLDVTERRPAAPGDADSSDLQAAHTCPRTARNAPDLDLSEVFPSLNFTVSAAGVQTRQPGSVGAQLTSALVLKVVQAGRLEFVGAGWSGRTWHWPTRNLVESFSSS